MFALFLIISTAVSYYYQPEEEFEIVQDNGFGKKLKKIGKKAKKAVKKVTKPITKPVSKISHKVTKQVKRTVKQVGKFIASSSSSAYINPIKVQSVTKEGSSSTFEGQIDEVASKIASTYGLDVNAIRNFLNSASTVVRLGGKSKRMFSNFALNILGDKRYRTAKLGTGVITAYKHSSGIGCTVGYVQGTASVFADTTMKKSSTRFGHKKSHSTSSWRPLEPSELNGVFSAVEKEVASDISAYKSN